MNALIERRKKKKKGSGRVADSQSHVDKIGMGI
jgi:hypothetical protein